jgi:alpha-beta hydrolase superfamily lysophospholipase
MPEPYHAKRMTVLSISRLTPRPASGSLHRRRERSFSLLHRTEIVMSTVLFIHGLWIHSSSWEPWIARFTEAGHHAVAPGWPGDGDTVADTRRHPERLAGVGVQAISAV